VGFGPLKTIPSMLQYLHEAEYKVKLLVARKRSTPDSPQLNPQPQYCGDLIIPAVAQAIVSI